MKTRFAVVAVAVMLSMASACQKAKNINPPRDIRNAPRMIETAMDVKRIGMSEPAPKPVEKILPKPDATKAHKAEVLKLKPQPVKPQTVVPKKLKGEPIDIIVGPGEKLPYKGSR